MTEEINFLEQVKAEREALEKIRNEIKNERERIEELKAVEILSGRTDAGKKEEPKKEVDNVTYATSALKGIISEE